MSLPEERLQMSQIAAALGSMRARGIRLWSADGQLHYEAPKGTLTHSDLQVLRSSKPQILAHLENVGRAQLPDPSIGPRPQSECAPLSFSQLAHWHLYRPDTRPLGRQIAAVTRLHGLLRVDALRASVDAVVQRHDALRTRIAVVNGDAIQQISTSPDCELQFDDLSGTPPHERELRVADIIERHIADPIDITKGQLFGARLLRLGADEHLLVTAMEHMIADDYSMRVLLRDVFDAYRHIEQGSAPVWSNDVVQFADFAAWQRDAHRSWSDSHEAYWGERLAPQRRLVFPDRVDSPIARIKGWGSTPLTIDRELRAQLAAWSRNNGTTAAMSVFTAYVALVLRWCDVERSVVRYQSDGRFSHKVSDSVGYFASTLYVPVQIDAADTLRDLLARMTTAYCDAYLHADFVSWKIARAPHLQFTHNTLFNWVPLRAECDLPARNGGLSCTAVPFAHPLLKNLELDREPGILLYDAGDAATGHVLFQKSGFPLPAMERFAVNLLRFVRELLSRPDARVSELQLRCPNSPDVSSVRRA